MCVWVCALIDAWKPRSIIIHFQTSFFTFSLDGWTWSDHCCLSVGGLGHLWGVCVSVRVYTCVCMRVICLTGQWSICLSDCLMQVMIECSLPSLPLLPSPPWGQRAPATASMWKSISHSGFYFIVWMVCQLIFYLFQVKIQLPLVDCSASADMCLISSHH